MIFLPNYMCVCRPFLAVYSEREVRTKMSSDMAAEVLCLECCNNASYYLTINPCNPKLHYATNHFHKQRNFTLIYKYA